MAELGGIKMSVFVILLLHFTAITGQNPLFYTVRAGEEVTLPCENVIQNQVKCSSTWLFAHYARRDTTVELVEHGQVKNDISKPKADRLIVKENCSLVIKNVTAEDVGRYYCQQYESSVLQGHGALVHLSVVTITEEQATDGVILTCHVFAFDGGCKQHTVEWLYEGDTSDVDLSPHSCSAMAQYSTSSLNQKPNYSELLKCNVTDKRTGQVLLCGVGPGPSCVKTGSTSAGDTTTSTEDGNPRGEGWLRMILVSVGLATFIIIVVAVNIWKRTTGKKTLDDNAVHYDRDGEDVTLDYENVGAPSASD